MTQSARRRERPVIIGVAGGSGSGKTTVVRRIVEKLSPLQVTCIQHDSYYHDRGSLPPAERAILNYDHPDSLDTQLLVAHLSQLIAGDFVRIPVYDFATHLRTTETVGANPHAVVLVEGILVLVDKALRDLMDIKVFVDTDSDIRLIRRLERDIATRQRTLDSVVRQYQKTVRPMHLEFVEPTKRFADIIIEEGGHNETAVEMLANKIAAIVKNPEPETPRE